MIDTIVKKLKKISSEPVWIALIAVGILGLGIIAALLIPGIVGILIALTPIVIFLLILLIINPYPFWLIYFALVPLSYIFQQFFPFESFVRFGGLIMVALTIPYIMLSKKSSEFKITPLGVSLLLFLAGCAFSLLSFFELEHSLFAVGLFLGNVLSYWVFVNIFRDEKKILKVINILIVVLTLESVYSLVIKFTGHPLARAQGTITDPNYFAFWLIPFLCFAFYFGLSASKRWLKILYFGAYLMMTVIIPLTYSRSMIIVMLPVQFILYWRRKNLLLFLLIIGLMIGLFYIGFSQIFEEGLNINSFLYGSRSASITWRTYFVETAIKIFYDHPFIGIGADNFRYMLNFYSTVSPGIVEYVVHNTYAEILSGTGLVGTVPFLAILFFSLRNLNKARKFYEKKGNRIRALQMEGFLVGFFGSLMAHFFLSTQHHITLWLFISLSTIVANLTFQKDNIKTRSLRRALR